MLIALAIVGIVIIGVLLVAASKPDEFSYSRSRQIAAQPQDLFALIQDFRQWTRWSPYEKKDPNMRREYSGPTSGPGSAYAWDGNKEIGAGRMEIVEIASPNRVDIKLEFFKPFKATNSAVFTIDPADNGSKVTWTMHGEMHFMCKLMSTFMDMDKMCGNDFDAGLKAMETAVSEKRAASLAG
jgi:hypothetical protein